MEKDLKVGSMYECNNMLCVFKGLIRANETAILYPLKGMEELIPYSDIDASKYDIISAGDIGYPASDFSKSFALVETKRSAIRKDYELMLREQRVLTRFVKNIKKELKSRSATYNDFLIRLNMAGTFEEFITSSFVWSNTPEAHDYWNSISNYNKK